MPKNWTPRHIIFKLQKIKDKENILKEIRGIKQFNYGEQEVELHLTYLHKPCKQNESGEIFIELREQKPVNVEFLTSWQMIL